MWSSDLSFATEPVFVSLANILGKVDNLSLVSAREYVQQPPFFFINKSVFVSLANILGNVDNLSPVSDE